MTTLWQSNETTVTEPVWARALMWSVFPLLGAGAGWLLKAIAGWVVSLPWAPLQGPFKLVEELVASFGEPQATIGALSLGAVAGVVLAFIAEQERLIVSVSDSRVRVARGEFSQEIERPSVKAIFVDRAQLVLLGRLGEELVRETYDLDTDRLRAAFVGHGYPWLSGGDPYKDEYRLWVENTPDLPAGADALLKARARALERGDNGKEDAAALHAELARLGVVVREENKRQRWRRTEEYPSA